ncbi:MAG: KpsF/GutQ family sugar-phosphate isomerase [Waddliaceae bacterium]|nr:KpsF/GutQ family sugar-phosphate isomerase [Waddliaceae bacterium]
MLRKLFNAQQDYINYFFNNLDYEQVQKVFEIFLHCKGTVVITGVGKSGIIARKLAATMVSTGTRAQYLSPMDALHGDLGTVTEKDVFVMLSKSGASDELFNLIPAVRNKGATLVALVSNSKSRLSRECDISVNLPLQKELCPFDLAPTTSATLQLIFGDVLTVALMRAKEFSIDSYALNHPAGRIGKRISLKVQDLMVRGVALPTCAPNTKLMDAIVDYSDKRCGCVLVLNEQRKLLGIFTDGDLRRALQNHGDQIMELTISEMMTATPRSIGPRVLAWKAMQAMEEDQKHPITVMPVIEEDETVVGLIKMHDIVQSGL